MLSQVVSNLLNIVKKYKLESRVTVTLNKEGLELSLIEVSDYYHKEATLDDVPYGLVVAVEKFVSGGEWGYRGHEFKLIEFIIRQETYDYDGGEDYLLFNSYPKKEGEGKTLITWEDMNIGDEEKEIIKNKLSKKEEVELQFGYREDLDRFKLDQYEVDTFNGSKYSGLPNVVGYMNKIARLMGTEESFDLNGGKLEVRSSEEILKKVKEDYEEIKKSIEKEEDGYIGGIVKRGKQGRVGVYLCTGRKKGNKIEGIGKMRVYIKGRNLGFPSMDKEKHTLNMEADQFIESEGVVSVASMESKGFKRGTSSGFQVLNGGRELGTFEELMELYGEYLGEDFQWLRDSVVEFNIGEGKPVKVEVFRKGREIELVDEENNRVVGIVSGNRRARRVDSKRLLRGFQELWEDIR